MRIYVFLDSRVVSFTLPKQKYGSYAFDMDQREDAKLINIEVVNDQWVLYSTSDVEVIYNKEFVTNVELIPGSFYIVKRYDKYYPVYAAEGFENTFSFYKYPKDLKMVIGRTPDCNIIYNCPFYTDTAVTIQNTDQGIELHKNSNVRVYRNNIVVYTDICNILPGDRINLYGFKIIFFDGYMLINNPGSMLQFNPGLLNLTEYAIQPAEEKKDLEVKDHDLYSNEDYFSKSPRIRRQIKTKDITISNPPQTSDKETEIPVLLTLGPMVTMAIISLTTTANVISQLIEGTTDLSSCWPRLLTSIVMVTSIIVWPTITKNFKKKLDKQKKAQAKKKYTTYLAGKKEELEAERNLQKDILYENVITLEDCVNNIVEGKLNFWSKRIEQNDFLNVRLGIGREFLDVDVKFPEEDFVIERDVLRAQAEKLVEDYKYIEEAPVGYSLNESRITGIMGEPSKQHGIVNNMILQLVSFYSYDDIKFVVFTNEANEKEWNYMKYLNHTFTNNKDMRFFSTNYESAKRINDYLNIELAQRIEISSDGEKRIFKPHYIIITDDYSQIKGLSFIKNVAEIDANLGFSLVIIENRISKLPSKCNNFILLGSNSSGVLRNSFEQQEQQPFNDEIAYNINMNRVAQIISNIPIEFQEGNSSLPDMITFLEMEKVGKVEKLNVLDRWKSNDSTQSLKAEVGVDPEGNLMYLDLHEKFHGPHGLIAGMTGSGKSEFIITYVLSMAVNYSPDDVAFILIDYKGGGLAFAFENKINNIVLPHLAGTITNLDKAEMDRTLVSIDSEVKRRQKLFNEARDKMGESTIDIYKYQGFYHDGKLSEPLPHLFIICDEFAELKSQQPEFMDNLISVARIGRSLGVHLILATQKPSGVVNDQIWSNSKFRVCLKVQDASDSKEMLKRPDAASLKQTGRFYLQVGYDEYFALGQSGWAGAKYFPSDRIQKQVDKSVNIIDETGVYIKSIQASNKKNKIEAQGEQLAAIINNIIEVSKHENKRARKLWLDNIPEIIFLKDIETKYNYKPQPYDVEVLLGEYDAPESQKQGPVRYNLKQDGNCLLYGMDGEEKEAVINAMLYSAFKNHKAEELNVYIVDYGSETTRMFADFPQVGGIVYASDEEKFKNTIKLIYEELKIRKKEFVSYGGSYEEYNKSTNNKLPQILFILNNYDGLAETYPSFYEDLTTIGRDCTRYGIYLFVTLNLSNSLNRRTTMNFPKRIGMHVTDGGQYTDIFDMRCKLRPRDMHARGLIYCDGGIHEFQTFSISDEQHTNTEIVQELLKEVKANNTTTAKKIPELPERVTFDLIEKDIKDYNMIPIGINRNTLKTAFIDFTNFPIFTISSMRIASMNNFMESLMEVISNINDCYTIFLDLQKQVPNVKNFCRNYYDDNFEAIIEEIINIEKDPEKKNNKYLYVLHGAEKIKSKVSSNKVLEDIVAEIKKNEHSHMILCDTSKALKSIEMDTWYMKSKNAADGLWIGKGFVDQSIFRIGKLTKEMSAIRPNNYAYLDTDAVPELVKLIEFKAIEEGDDEDEE